MCGSPMVPRAGSATRCSPMRTTLRPRVEALTAENQRLQAAQRAASGSASELKTLQNTNAELKSALDQARAEVTRLRAAGARRARAERVRTSRRSRHAPSSQHPGTGCS